MKRTIMVRFGAGAPEKIRAAFERLRKLVPVAHDDQQGGKPVEVDRG